MRHAGTSPGLHPGNPLPFGKKKVYCRPGNQRKQVCPVKPYFVPGDVPCREQFFASMIKELIKKRTGVRADGIVLQQVGKRTRFPAWLSFMKLDCMSKIVIAFLTATLLVGCAKAQPVIYPNAHYQDVGRQAAQQDIANCMALADSAGVSSSKHEAEEEAGKAAGGTAAGAATGAVGGAIAGGAASAPCFKNRKTTRFMKILSAGACKSAAMRSLAGSRFTWRHSLATRGRTEFFGLFTSLTCPLGGIFLPALKLCRALSAQPFVSA